MGLSIGCRGMPANNTRTIQGTGTSGHGTDTGAILAGSSRAK